MQIDDQVISLELAKKLKELGIKQDSLFVWEYYDDKCYGVKFIPYAVVPGNFNKVELYSAFTADELLEIIPAYINIGEQHSPFNYYWLYINKRSAQNIQYCVRYVCDTMEAVEISNPCHQLRSSMKSYDENLIRCLEKLTFKLIKDGFINGK